MLKAGNTCSDSQPSSLFGEVYLSEIKKLEESLKAVENDKQALTAKLHDSQNVQRNNGQATNATPSTPATDKAADPSMVSVGELQEQVHKVKALQDELDVRKLQLQEFETLKNIAEKQVRFDVRCHAYVSSCLCHLRGCGVPPDHEFAISLQISLNSDERSAGGA